MYQALSILEIVREENNATEESTYVFDSSHKGKWVTEKLVVGSGAVECGTSRKSAALEVEEASESSRGETWTCAGRNETKKRAR